MPRTRRETQPEPKQRPAGNTLPTQALEYIKRIETLEAEKKTLTTAIGEDIKIVYEQAEREHKIAPEVLKDCLTERKFLRKRAEKREKMEPDVRAQCDVLADAFGEADPEFASLLRQMAADGTTVTITTATSHIEAQHQTDEIDRAFG